MIDAIDAKLEDLKARAIRAACQGRHDDCEALNARAHRIRAHRARLTGEDRLPANTAELVANEIRTYGPTCTAPSTVVELPGGTDTERRFRVDFSARNAFPLYDICTAPISMTRIGNTIVVRARYAR